MKQPTDIKNKLSKVMNFDSLVSAISGVHTTLNAHAGRAVNISLTLRNWFIGCYIAEYQLSGADRAKYGDNLLETLSKRLKSLKVSTSGHRQLYDYLRFYRVYPQIAGTLSPLLHNLLPNTEKQNASPLSTRLQIVDNKDLIKEEEISHSVSAKFNINAEKLIRQAQGRQEGSRYAAD